MPDISELSEAKRALLEKYLHGDLPLTAKTVDTITSPTQEIPIPPSATDPRSSIVTIQTGGSKRPFFYLHVHVIGSAFYCFSLAHDLGSDQPFYILEPYNLDGLEMPPPLEAMAAAYIKSLRSVQPEGPYLLGGYCGGGLIAFEMAQQLRLAGQAVDLLVLIEPRAGPPFLRMIVHRLFGRFVRGIGNLIRLRQSKQLDLFLRLRHVYRLLRHRQYRNAPGFSLAPTAEALRQDWIGMFVWMTSQYIPRYYPGKVTYFWASDKPGRHGVRWGMAAKSEEVDIHFIPGKRDTCRTQHLHEMAEHLSAYLNKAQVSY